MGVSTPKQYLDLQGRPMIEHTLARLSACAQVTRLMVGVDENSSGWRSLDRQGLKPVRTASPGAERADTVASCLQAICDQGGQDDWVLVHDAARPCVRARDISELITRVIGFADGGILAVPVSDTLKLSKPGNYIDRTVTREKLWRAMTPQLFKSGELLSAIQTAQQDGIQVTDEASAMEYAGAQVLLVPCAPDNIKVTLPEDIRFAELILQGQAQ